MSDLASASISAQRAAHPERLREQGRGETPRVFLVALVERLSDRVAQLAQPVADGVAPVADEVEVHEQRLRPRLR